MKIIIALIFILTFSFNSILLVTASSNENILKNEEIWYMKTSSVAWDGHYKEYRAWPHTNLIDHNKESHWCPSEDRNIQAEWVHFHFYKDLPITKIGIINGNGSKNESFFYDGRAKDLIVQLCNGWHKVLHLEDHSDVQYFEIEGPPSECLRLIFLNTYPPEKWEHTCLSEIELIIDENKK